MTQEINEWYDLALTDYGVAKHLDQTYYPKPREIICYHCQQAAEKAIKAVIIYYGAEGGLPKIHDLSFLLDQVKNKAKIEGKYYDYADTLTPYGTIVRYPSELFLEDKHVEEALKITNELLLWANNIINV